MKYKYKLAFMDMAERFGKTSEAVRLKVGALIVKNEYIISLGCNGMPPKWPTEVCEELGLATAEKGRAIITKAECRHAEEAALEKLWNSPETAKDSVMFISHSPCLRCAIKLKTAGISKVYYRHEYRCKEGVDFLTSSGIMVEQI